MNNLIWEQVGTIQHRALLDKDENLYIVVFEPICFLNPYEAQIRKGETNIIVSTDLPNEIDNLMEAKSIASSMLSLKLKMQIGYLNHLNESLHKIEA